jgi:hypothetical protein
LLIFEPIQNLRDPVSADVVVAELDRVWGASVHPVEQAHGRVVELLHSDEGHLANLLQRLLEEGLVDELGVEGARHLQHPIVREVPLHFAPVARVWVRETL